MGGGREADLNFLFSLSLLKSLACQKASLCIPNIRVTNITFRNLNGKKLNFSSFF